MFKIVVKALNYEKTVAALHALDEGKRYAPKMTATKSAVITALEALIIPRVNVGKGAHYFKASDIAEIAGVSLKVGRMAAELAVKAGLLKVRQKRRWDSVKSVSIAARYIFNADFIEEVVPQNVSQLRWALAQTGQYGDLAAIDLMLEAIRNINASKGHKVLTLPRALEILEELEGERWSKVKRASAYWENYYNSQI